ncbi:MAG: hypothetical protein GY859_06455, partial [Desulfobacterales bacterium]|nr:hypothetical protein [Desulfobacterales bacterium]
MIACYKKVRSALIILLGIILSCSIALAQPAGQPREEPLVLSTPADGAADGEPESSEVEKKKPSLGDLCFDPEDGALDLSAFLLTAKGFLPLGGVITEPAVGYGGVLGVMFLHDSIKDRAKRMKERDPDGSLTRLPPPNITAAGGFLTENGSWGGGLFHFHVFKEDKLRYLGGLFDMEMNLDYYGKGGDFPLLPIDHVSYSLKGYYLVQQLAYRVGDSDLFLGANFKYMTYDAKLDFGLNITPPDWFPPLEKTLTSGGVGVFAEYDTRDSIFTPDRGINVRLESVFYEDIFGSDRDYNKTSLNARAWTPLHPSWILGLRADANFSD